MIVITASVAVTMVLREVVQEKEGLSLEHLACLREELNFSALNYLWLRCSSKGREIVPGKVLGALE